MKPTAETCPPLYIGARSNPQAAPHHYPQQLPNTLPPLLIPVLPSYPHPRSACLIIDYGSKEGMRLPKGEWPRVRQGVGFKEPLTW
jgi:hypothetical protein